MPNPRKEFIATGETYHIFNRSIANEEIFANTGLFNHALKLANFYRFRQKIRFSQFRNLSLKAKENYQQIAKNFQPLVEIYSFGFMPNHFHLLLKQITEDGIKNFISNFQNGYAKYFNLRKNRKGGLFISPFKSKRIESEEQLIHVSRYIHLNPVTAFLIDFDRLRKYPFTSFPYYLEKKIDNFVNIKPILNIFGSPQKYSNFVSDQVDYQRTLQEIKNLLSEE